MFGVLLGACYSLALALWNAMPSSSSSKQLAFEMSHSFRDKLDRVLPPESSLRRTWFSLREWAGHRLQMG